MSHLYYNMKWKKSAISKNVKKVKICHNELFPIVVYNPVERKMAVRSFIHSFIYFPSCASLSVPAEESKGWSVTIFYLLYSLIGKPKLILQIKNKPLTVSLLHSQSRPRGSKLHYIPGRIYARIYPLDIGCLSCYNMCSGYIASSLKCYHFRTCEGGKPPFNPPF